MILAGWLTGEERKRIDQSLSNVTKLSRSRLNIELDRITGSITELRHRLGARAKPRDYELLLARAGARPGTLLFVPKWVIERVFFSRYEKAFPDFVSLPPHARIGIDGSGILQPTKPEASWRLLEATLFEDVALLWNSALDAAAADRLRPSKAATKWRDALLRSTARAAFYLLEGYLNGLAFDTLVTQRPLEEDDVRKLREWDQQRSRSSLLSLRDKLLQYPKIALRSAHPPLNESKCPELKFVLEKEELWRHALVHPAPRMKAQQSSGDHPLRKFELTPSDAASLDIARDVDVREAVFFELDVEDVGETVDNVIRLIRRMSSELGNRFGNLDMWLTNRESDGRFPASVFD